MPDLHALLGPSSAHMWMACPPSARLGESFEDQGSVSAGDKMKENAEEKM